ncbi:MAG: type II toxin-antitoxin system prevent-host-death family antitoxin [Alphaproteobacteria bacterium]|nr:type II toxin-antitoxin system prevent-host-death family antitoxin [Alphaproteobacteria bacterium]
MEPHASSTIALKDAKAGLSGLVDQALKGAFVTITRHGKPVAALVPVKAANLAQQALGVHRPSLAAHLAAFPGLDVERNQSPSRDIEV